MGMTLVMNPAKLAWSHFQVVASPVMPNGATSSAFTNFTWEYGSYTPVQTGGMFALPDLRLVIEPDCRIWKDSAARTDKAKGDALLSHEQFHYDLAHVIGRVVIVKMSKLRARTEAILKTELDVLLDFHFITRADLINRRYDLETNHGMNKHYQTHWKRLMDQTLLNPNALTLGGYWL
jgi:hypothetical protein